MLQLRDVYREPYAKTLLYCLLSERTPEQSISHREMPTWGRHCHFFAGHPYFRWYLIVEDGDYDPEDEEAGYVPAECVGMCYITREDEVGIALFRQHQGRGYGSEAIRLLREKHQGNLIANVNPDNVPSRKLWEKLGGKLIQVTYELPEYSPPAKRVKLTGEAFGGQTEWTQ